MWDVNFGFTWLRKVSKVDHYVFIQLTNPRAVVILLQKKLERQQTVQPVLTARVKIDEDDASARA